MKHMGSNESLKSGILYTKAFLKKNLDSGKGVVGSVAITTANDENKNDESVANW